MCGTHKIIPPPKKYSHLIQIIPTKYQAAESGRKTLIVVVANLVERLGGGNYYYCTMMVLEISAREPSAKILT